MRLYARCLLGRFITSMRQVFNPPAQVTPEAVGVDGHAVEQHMAVAQEPARSGH